MTATLVHHENEFTVQPLFPSSEPLRDELLELTIDITDNSQTLGAIRVGCDSLPYSQDTYQSRMNPLIQRKITGAPRSDTGENSYTQIVQPALESLAVLSAITFLQLWVKDGEENSSGFFDAAKILMSLYTFQTSRIDGVIPNHTILGLHEPTGSSTHQLLHDGELVVANIEQKGKGFVEYLYDHSCCLNHEVNTKDLFIDHIISGSKTLESVLESINHVRKQKFQGRWQSEVLHLLAQVRTNACSILILCPTRLVLV